MYTNLCIEITTYCNAACPSCEREDLKKHEIIHMQDNVWDSIVENADDVTYIMFNGTYGDFSMHPKAIDFLHKLADRNPNMCISIHTNGGARNELFWTRLADACNRFDEHTVHFAFDGMEDTNHLYRKNVIWERLVRNAKAFNNAGGYGVMRMIVFDHNYHQIDKNKKLAQELNFSKFELNRAIQIIEVLKDDTEVIWKCSKSLEEIKNLADIKNENFKPNSFLSYKKVTGDSSSLCPWKQFGEVQIQSDGIVWPCCHWPGRMSDHSKNKKNNNIPSIIGPFLQSLNIVNNSLKDIYHSQFSKELENVIRDKKEPICVKCKANNYFHRN